MPSHLMSPLKQNQKRLIMKHPPPPPPLDVLGGVLF